MAYAVISNENMEINRNDHCIENEKRNFRLCASGWVNQTAIVKEFIVKWQCHVDKCVG